MKMICCFNSAITMILVTLSMSGVHCIVSLIESRLKEHLSAQPVGSKVDISKRTKRDRPFLTASRDVIPNNYRFGPDFANGPSPAPGISLDERIFLSNDGQYHGNARRYKGDVADLTATTQFTPPYEMFGNTEAGEEVTGLDLREIQSRINRLRLKTTSVPPSTLTIPAIAYIQDPNYGNIQGAIQEETRRMMAPAGNEMTMQEAKALKTFRFKYDLMFPGLREHLPFNYDPNQARFLSTTPRFKTLATVPLRQLDPLELFRRLYGTTTTRKIRIRKPRPKASTVSTSSPMKDEYLPEESDIDESITTENSILSDKPVIDNDKIDEQNIRSNIPRFKAEDNDSDIIPKSLNAPESGKGYETDVAIDTEAPEPYFESLDKIPIISEPDKIKMERKEFALDKPTLMDQYRNESIEHIESFLNPEEKNVEVIFDQPAALRHDKMFVDKDKKNNTEIVSEHLEIPEMEIKDDNKSEGNISLHILPDTKKHSNYRKMETDDIVKQKFELKDDKNLVKHVKSSDDLKLVIPKNIDKAFKEIEMPVVKTLGAKSLEQELSSLKSYVKPVVINQQNMSDDAIIKVKKPGHSMASLMKGYEDLPTKKERLQDMNEDLKELLMSEGESYDMAKPMEESDEEYDDPGKIKGIPIRRRRRVNMFPIKNRK